MSAREKIEIMKVANWLVHKLINCEDFEFVDMVLSNVAGGCYIDYDEMQEIVQDEDYEED